MTLDQVRALLLKRAKPCGKARRGSTGVRAWCIAHGVNHSHVSDFMNSKRRPGSDVLGALGLEWRVMRAGKVSAARRRRRL